MVDKTLKREHILKALVEIDKSGIPPNRKSTKYNLYHNGKAYPPKYVLSIAKKIATGKELEPSKFNGGEETNSFLSTFEFEIREGNLSASKAKSKIGLVKTINICTAIVQIQLDNWDEISNSDKFELLTAVIDGIDKDTDVLVLSAGFFNSGNRKPSAIFSKIETAISEMITQRNKELIICLGLDGRNKTDQLALAINKTGIIAIARKFHHKTPTINLASNAFSIEENKERHFSIKGKRAYLAVCYDIFGISKFKLENKNKYNFIIGVVHGFGRSGGDSDFARKGLAGASKQWKVHSFASAVFSDGRNPTNWTSGVEWRHGDASVKNFTYDEIRIMSTFKIIETKVGTIYLRKFKE